MKLFRLLPALLLLTAIQAFAVPAPYSFDFKVERKKLEGTRTSTLEHKVSDEKWCYTITINNQSFKDVPNIDIKYIIYFKKETEGSKVTKEKHITGKSSAAMLQNNGNFTFDTDSVELIKSQLDNGFYYVSGARTRSRDALTGIWLRLYQGGTMIGEYADPQTLTTGKWEEK